LYGLTETESIFMSSYPDEIELDIDGMAQGGAGVGRWEGRVIFASGGLPGERVRVRLKQRKSSFAHGQVVEVLTPSPDRVPPRLPGADHIPWQHIAYPAQLRFKQTILSEQLAKLADLAEPPVAPMLPARHPWGYRNTAHLWVKGTRIGYHAAGTHRVVNLAHDPLLLPILNAALAGLHAAIDTTAWEVEQVTLRASAAYGYATAIIYGTGTIPALAQRWRARVPYLADVTWQFTDDPDAPSPEITLHEELDDVVFSLAPDSFFQTHTAQAATLLDVVRRGLDLAPGARLLDAYSGAGTFALPLARDLAEIVAIEEHPQAVADGEWSAQLNNVSNVDFITAPVERVLPELEPPFDAAILDPPRRGCHPAALAALVELRPPRIAYISCHPGILARDLRPLLDGGYRLLQVQPIDLFPQTPHIECVALLEM
jgi:23S rRNA (uracil1939-C5)-methyltransferase